MSLIKPCYNIQYCNFESGFDENSIIKMRKRADKIFPYSNDIDYYMDALHKSKFRGEVFTEIINKTVDECKLFMKTPRLSEIAPLINNIEERAAFIDELLTTLFHEPGSDLFTEEEVYSSYWHYGLFSKVQ